MAKVASALAAGCTMVLKPSEYAPLSAGIVAEVLAEAGCPPGVFNMVHGDGPGTGAARSPPIPRSICCPSPAPRGPGPR